MTDQRLPVTIAVPTFHRPEELRVLLPLLKAQAEDLDAAGATRTDVLVVDNDAGASGRAAAEEAGVRYVVEPQPGIAAARNRALDESAGSRLLAFIDDDEHPHAGWLRELVRVWRISEPALVSGRVVAEFERPPGRWIEEGRFFVRRSLPTGTPLQVAAAGNLLLDLDQVRESGVRFALDLGLSGGEDTLFSRRLARAGYRMVWCNESVITDLVPAARISRRWVLRRAWSHGNSTAVVSVRLAGGRAGRAVARIRAVVGGAARVVLGVARTALGLLLRSPGHQARGSRAAYRGAGMVWAAFGGVYQEYARTADGAEK
ncbi:glycosyltransferase family 2 protein [Leifsonia soli]|uniref:Glycosyltransferase involved in cell wall biosynthesis n=1 Tax=Leifsonia soli TaxID=582665 RepID=A0A852T166_9MICO|nr:glycosyltransferase [Leifsonia soli]NYD74631.1 glycosyltransferase involved in cell wall biosynthesis [Leifsonia soli]